MNIYKPMFLGPDLHLSALAESRPDFKTLAKAGSKAGLSDFKIFKQKPARVGGLSDFKYLIYIYADKLSDLESFEISGRALGKSLGTDSDFIKNWQSDTSKVRF